MKEGGAMEAGQGKKVGGGMRSETEKEKTKMRERQRRFITTNIFHGLRKHGGYRLSPRADINEVLRFLATEAGWIVEPDGTTYRSSASVFNSCPFCGAFRSVTLTGSNDPIVGGGECSSTSSPRRFPIPLGEYSTMLSHSIAKGIPFYGAETITNDSTAVASSSCSSPNLISAVNGDAALALYMYGGEEGGVPRSGACVVGGRRELQDGERASSEKAAEGQVETLEVPTELTRGCKKSKDNSRKINQSLRSISPSNPSTLHGRTSSTASLMLLSPFLIFTYITRFI